MSDVLVKGMKLPRSCFNDREGYCTFHLLTYHGLHHCSQTGSKCLKSRRPKDCPLVEVKAHGRLIDADDFIYNFEDIINESRRVLSEKGEDIRVLNNFHDTVSELVGLMPTIVEAST